MHACSRAMFWDHARSSWLQAICLFSTPELMVIAVATLAFIFGRSLCFFIVCICAHCRPVGYALHISVPRLFLERRIVGTLQAPAVHIVHILLEVFSSPARGRASCLGLAAAHARMPQSTSRSPVTCPIASPARCCKRILHKQ